MIRKIDSNIFSLTILKVTTFSRIRHFDEFTKLPLIVNLFKYAVKTPQFAKEIAVFLPQFLYICSRKHQIRQEIWNF